MSTLKLNLPHAAEMHPKALTSHLKRLFGVLVTLHFGIYLEDRNYRIDWNNVYEFWDIRIFEDVSESPNLGTTNYRKQQWQRTLDLVPAAFGSEFCSESRWTRDANGVRVYDKGQEWGIRFWVYPDKTG